MNLLSKNISQLVISGWLLLAAAAPVGAENLKSAVVLDSFAYTPSELFDLYRTFLGEPVGEKTATDIAVALRDKYAQDGFARPGFAILDRGTQSGIVRIRVTEASISRIEFDGDAGPYRETIERMFGHLPPGSLLRPAEFRKTLQRARRLRGLDVGIETVADPEASGAFLMQVQSAYKPVSGRINLSNRGTQEIGRKLASGILAANGLFGSDSTVGIFMASAQHSRDYLSGGAFLDAAAGPSGAAVQLRASSASLHIVSSGILVEQRRDRYSFKIAQPLTLGSGLELSVWTGLDMDNLNARQDGAVSQEDRLRSVNSGVSTNWRGASSINQFTLELELGINGLGSRVDDFNNPDDARENNFAIAELHYVHRRELGDKWTVRWDAYAQHSPHHLPSIKRFKVGGSRIGRGFEAAAASGDRGAGNKLELKRRIGWGSDFLSLADLYTFYDLGSAWRNDGSARESAASAGLGIAIRGSQFSSNIEVAKPLTHDDVDGNRDFGIFVEVAAAF